MDWFEMFELPDLIPDRCIVRPPCEPSRTHLAVLLVALAAHTEIAQPPARLAVHALQSIRVRAVLAAVRRPAADQAHAVAAAPHRVPFARHARHHVRLGRQQGVRAGRVAPVRMLVGQLQQIGGQLGGVGQLQPVRRPGGGGRRPPPAVLRGRRRRLRGCSVVGDI